MIEKRVLLEDASKHTHFKGYWTIGTVIAKGDWYSHPTSGIMYEATMPHTASATTEPGVGEDWESYWNPAGKGAKGDTGASGDGAYHSSYTVDHIYIPGDTYPGTVVGKGQSVYRCKVGHVGAEDKRPESGENWAAYSEMYAEGGTDGAGSGDVEGPASAVAHNFAGFADSGGKGLEDSGIGPDDVNFDGLDVESSTPDGSIEKIKVYIPGVGYRGRTIDNFAKRREIRVLKAGAWEPSQTDGCADSTKLETTTNKRNLRVLPFNYDKKRYACIDFVLPNNYDGQPINAYVISMSTGSTVNGFRVGLQGTTLADGESLDAAWGAAVEVTDYCQGVAYTSLKSPKLSNITLGGTPAGGELCSLRLYRDPTHADDNLDEILYILAVVIDIGLNKWSEA